MFHRAALIAALALTGCNKPAANDVPASSNRTDAKPPQDYVAQIDKLLPAHRQMVLFRAIRDAGQDCQDVNKVERLGDIEGRATWRVTCRGGGQWAVQIGADGLANVTGPPARRP